MPFDTAKTARRRRKHLLAEEADCRRTGDWGSWVHSAPPLSASGWGAEVRAVHSNLAFCVSERLVYPGVLHLAVLSLSGARPAWPEMQRIKDEIAGPARVAIEVYPPSAQVVDGADVHHLWVLPEGTTLPFGLHL